MLKRVFSLLSAQKRALRAYRNWVERLPISQNSILIDQENGLSLDGSMYYLMRELLTKPEYGGYSVYFAVAQENKDEFERRLEDRGLSPVLVVRGTKEYLYALATAKYLLTDNTFPTYMVKREGQVLLNTWHGIPLKTLGRSEKTDLTKCGNVQRNLALADYLLFPNQNMERLFMRDYMLEGLCSARIIRCGYPRNEAFFASQGRADGIRRYAWLPTFRGVGEGRGKEPLWLMPALEQLDALLQDNEVLYLKLHAVQQGSVDLSRFAHIAPMPTDRELYEVLAQCDGLLTDFSSVMFDFLLGGHKVVLWAPDKDEYVLERGTYTRMEDLPFCMVFCAEDAIRELRSPKYYDDSALMEQCWPGETRGASELVLHTVLAEDNTDATPAQKTSCDNETLVYSELGGDLLALNAYLLSLMANGPVRLAFPMNCGVGHEEFLASLPESVRLTPLWGLLLSSIPERIEVILASKVAAGPLAHTADSVYSLERRRLFGNVVFAKVVVHDGKDLRWTDFFRWLERQ